MSSQQTDALRLTEIARYCFRSEGMSDPPEQFESPTGDMVDYFDHVEIEKALLARITELESQLAQRFDAADVATAAAQGFRDGVASVSAGSEPVAWMTRLPSGSEVFARTRDFYPDATPVYTHPSPQEGMARWQPIETAPKDGQAILVTDGRGCYCVEWSEEFDWWTVDDNKLGPFRLRGSAPTHWMPTPSPQAAPAPPPECETEAEKRAFAFGWFKALESERMKAESVQEDAARYRLLRRGQHWSVIDGIGDDLLRAEALDAALDAARKQGANHDR